MANSLDTNILIYAANEDVPEHPAALAIVDEMLARPQNWILADQVLFEFYRALRNPKILQHPLSAVEAAKRIHFLREEIGVTRCCYDLEHWVPVFRHLAQNATPAARTHDIVLGVTLKANGVTTFVTRNTRDFEPMEFAELLNPIDG
jgi:uncharacterized protein